jgi:hypothetical protein
MPRFRRKSGENVDRGIDRMRQLVERHGASPVITAAAKAIPARLRQSAYAVATDLVLGDGKIDPAERRFLDDLGTKLGLDRNISRSIADVMLIKDGA